MESVNLRKKIVKSMETRKKLKKEKNKISTTCLRMNTQTIRLEMWKWT